MTPSPGGAGFVDRLAERLEPLGDVRTRRMFGAWGLYQGDTIFGIVDSGRLYLKTDERTRGRFESRGSTPFRPSERQTLKRYWLVPADVLEDSDALLEWAAEAVRAARGGTPR